MPFLGTGGRGTDPGVAGKSDREIADEMRLSEKTVESPCGALSREWERSLGVAGREIPGVQNQPALQCGQRRCATSLNGRLARDTD